MSTPLDSEGGIAPLDPGKFPHSPSVGAPATAMSDRAGDALGVQDHGFAVSPGWMAHAIATLDSASGSGPAPTAGVRPRQGASNGRRREIIDAAAELFAIHGYRGASLREISARVGISHPGMLHYFKSKDVLLDAVIDDLEGHAQHVIDQIQSIETSVERFERTVARDFATDAHQILLLAVLATEAIDPEFPGRMRIIRLRRVYEHILEHVLRTFDKREQLREGLDLAWAARMLVSATISLATREATIGAVQSSSAGVAGPDYLALLALMRR